MLLAVDDDPQFLEEVRQAFAADTHVLLATDGEHALGLLHAVGADLSVALIDLDLPKVDGFHLISTVRRAAPELPVIAVRASSRTLSCKPPKWWARWRHCASR